MTDLMDAVTDVPGVIAGVAEFSIVIPVPLPVNTAQREPSYASPLTAIDQPGDLIQPVSPSSKLGLTRFLLVSTVKFCNLTV